MGSECETYAMGRGITTDRSPIMVVEKVDGKVRIRPYCPEPHVKDRDDKSPRMPHARENIIQVTGTNASQLLIDIIQYGGYAHSFFRESTLTNGTRQEGDIWYVSQYEYGTQTPCWDVMSARPTGKDQYAVRFLTKVRWPKGKSLKRFVSSRQEAAV